MRPKRILGLACCGLWHTSKCSALSISFSGEELCPVPCSESGPDPGNWTVYHSFDRINYCDSPMVLSFSVYNSLDDAKAPVSFRVCTTTESNGSGDSSSQASPAETASTNTKSASITKRTAWDNSSSTPNMDLFVTPQALWSNGPSAEYKPAEVSSLASRFGKFLTDFQRNFSTGSSLFFLHDPTTSTSLGLYTGTGVPASPLVQLLSEFISGHGYSGNLAIQGCSSKLLNETHGSLNRTMSGTTVSAAAGIIAASGADSLAQVQQGLRTWANSSCIEAVDQDSAILSASLQIMAVDRNLARRGSLPAKRGTCRTVTVKQGDLCGDLASRCGISLQDFISYNPQKNLCTNLKVPQLVCCSTGPLPIPTADSAGNCNAHEVGPGESCWKIVEDNYNFFTVQDLEDFNKNTWGWGGCSNLQAHTIICLSTGRPPLPKPVANAACGPVKPGTLPPPAGVKMSDLNPCPLNSCCDVWGFCGTTDEFCRPIAAGQAPGAPQPLGAPNCISNCGTEIVQVCVPGLPRITVFLTEE